MSDRSKKPAPSSNWLSLQKRIAIPKDAPHVHKSSVSAFAGRKRRKLEHHSESPVPAGPAVTERTRHRSANVHEFPRGRPAEKEEVLMPEFAMDEVKNGESLQTLRRMVCGQVEHMEVHKQPGKYLALDCEMVGVGIDGTESALARVSLVNFHGFVLVDRVVRPRERVVDYRTAYSGIRPSDMARAKPFGEVQKEVADLLKNRILVGHAVHNDLRALLLSQPGPQIRDTQILARKHQISRGRYPALRSLVLQELGLTIQGGEHSSVTDARATMAVFRLHRVIWEKNVRPIPLQRSLHRLTSTTPPPPVSRKRARTPPRDETGSESEDKSSDTHRVSIAPKDKTKGKTKAKSKPFPVGGRAGISSGLSTVVKRLGPSGKTSHVVPKSRSNTKPKVKWWKELGSARSKGSKGSVLIKAG